MVALIRKFELFTESIDHAEDLLSTVYSPVEVKGDGSRLHLRVSGVWSEDFSLYRTQSTSGVTFTSEPAYDGYNLSVCQRGSQAVSLASRTKPAVLQGPVVACDAAEIKQVQCAPGVKFKGLSLDSSLMHACLAERLDGPVVERIRFAPGGDADASAMQTLLSISDALFTGLEGDAALARCPAAVTHLKQALAHLMLTGIPNNYSERLAGSRHPSAAPKHVVRAIDFMNSHVREPLTLTDIARAADTSPRALQDGFRRFRDTTPLAYLRTLRLQGVQRELRNPRSELTISQVALEWGFGHMGMFAAYYKQAFGESPRQTVARRTSVPRPEQSTGRKRPA